MKKFLLAAAGVSLFGLGVALAQLNQNPAQVTSVGTSDLFDDVVAGVGTQAKTYATAAQITNVPGYQLSIPLTAFSLTFKNGQTWWLINPAGTLATGTFTMAPNPGDGARNCWKSTQTQTAVTITANTGQTIGGTAVTAGVAGTAYCWTYQASTATWWPS